MSIHPHRESFEELAQKKKESIRIHYLQPRIRRDNYQGEIFLTRLLISDSQKRCQQSIEAIKSIKALNQKLDVSCDFIIQR